MSFPPAANEVHWRAVDRARAVVGVLLVAALGARALTDVLRHHDPLGALGAVALMVALLVLWVLPTSVRLDGHGVHGATGPGSTTPWSEVAGWSIGRTGLLGFLPRPGSDPTRHLKLRLRDDCGFRTRAWAWLQVSGRASTLHVPITADAEPAVAAFLERRLGPPAR